MKCKNTIAMVLAGAMLLPTNAFAADLSKYKDFPNDWSAKALEQAIDDGLLNGSNGMIDAKGLLTRAQMAAIVSRAFGATKTASLSSYKDVLPSAWYYSDMGKAVKMGAFQGSNGLLNPDAPITREEAFTVLARAFALEGGNSAVLKDFVDGGTVSSWASESVAALVANGYVNGSNGMLNLKNNITRAEFAKVITGMAASYVGAESVSGKTVDGNVIVRESGASLSGMTINGDLIIADSADKVSLDGVTVTGRIVIRGGADSVSMKDTKASKGVLVSSPNGAAAISVSGGSVGTVTAKSDLAVTGGSVDKVVLEDGASLTVSKGASVGSVTVSDAGSKVSGDGTVTSVQANANNVTVSTKNTKVTAASGVSGVKAGDKTVEAGKTETVGSNSSSGGSSGGGGSSQSQYTYVLMNIPYDEFYKAEIKNDKSVDAVSSATKNKTANSALVGGSYHKEDKSEITGVTFPVRVLRTTDLTKVDSEDALFAGASYAYYATSTTPSVYKDLTVAEDGSFTLSEVKGTETAVSDAKASITDSSNYGDYQISLSGDELTEDKLGTVYGVVLNTEEGSSYGLRHLENIWKSTSLAFSTGFTTTSHGNTLAPEHYKALMGQTINSITYYTSTGIKKISVDLYVPIKFENTLEVGNALDHGEADVTATGFPEDYDADYEVLFNGEKVEGAVYNAETKKISLPTDAKIGVYTAKVSDKGGKYASYSTTFENQTSINPVQSSDSTLSLAPVSGKDDEDVKDYVSAITEVTVNDTVYKVSGKDAVKVFNATGGLNLNVAAFSGLKKGSIYTITVTATAYTTPLTFEVKIPETIYAYAAVPYDEYWKNENVYMTGDNWKASSDESDYDYDYNKLILKEHDKGAFDATSRATARHGIHRGSYQQVLTFHTQEGKDLEVAYWNSASSLVLKDGSTATFTSTTPTTTDEPVATIKVGRNTTYHMTGSTMTGIKYVPVKVDADIFDEFSKKYEVTMNGDYLTGGYTERMLLGYTDLVADVDANTDGIKTVTKSGDDFSFSARDTSGTGSGIKGAALKEVNADDVVITPQKFSGGTYGSMFRVHITNKNEKAAASSDDNVYGQLGSRMQSVTWQYYGNGNTVLRTYGTKFAADIWMHGSNGIQLGLTDSLRAKLPAGTDGTGKWVGTIHALGYKDFTFTVNLVDENVRDTGKDPMTEDQKTQLTALKDQAGELLTNYDASKATDNEKLLKEHYDEVAALLENKDATTSAADELLGELPKLIKAVQDERDNQPAGNTKAEGEATVTSVDGKQVAGSYQAKVIVEFDKDGKVISVTDNGTTPGDMNLSFWNNAKAMFDKFVGKTAKEVDSIDAVSYATVSSNAIKEAVKNALGSNN